MAYGHVAATQNRNRENNQDGHRHDQVPSNGTRDPDGYQSRSGEISTQCGVLRAHLLLNLPSQSRMVRQGRLGLRAKPDSGDDVLGPTLGLAMGAEPLKNDENVSAAWSIASMASWPRAGRPMVSRVPLRNIRLGQKGI